jgi:hypothetical protein
MLYERNIVLTMLEQKKIPLRIQCFTGNTAVVDGVEGVSEWTRPPAPRSNRFPMGGVEEASTFQTHNTSRLRFRDDPLHFAEFIRFGEYDCFGTAIASIQLRKLHIVIQKGDFS